MGIINELWRGNISPQERHEALPEDYRKVLSRLCDEEKKMIEGMPEEARAQFDVYEDLVNKEHYLSLERTFEDGFRLGAMFVLDIMREQ